MMSTAEFLASLRERDIRLVAEGDKLRCNAPAGALTPQIEGELKRRKGELIALLREAGALSSRPRGIVPLKSTGDRPPIFAVPGHNGDVFCYLALSEHLPANQPLYGLQPPGLESGEPLTSVTDLAAHHARALRGFGATSPFLVAGYCAGGTVAFELARQLAEAGETVALLGLFGSPFPTAYRFAAQAMAGVRGLGERLRRHAAAIAGGSVSNGLTHLRERVRSRALERAAEKEKLADPAMAARRHVEEATLAAVRRYEPRRYQGRIDLFFPSAAWRHSGDLPDEWSTVARVVEHVGPDDCNGDVMLREPHVRALARLLESAMRASSPPEG